MTAAYFAGVLASMAGGTHPLVAWHAKRLARRGVDRALRFTYEFHGFGCTIGPWQRAINFDFDRSGGIALLDPSRVFEFGVLRKMEMGSEAEFAESFHRLAPHFPRVWLLPDVPATRR